MMALTSLFSNYDAIVVFDVETSGLDPYKDQMVELAAQKLWLNKDTLWFQKLHCYIKLYDDHKMSQEAIKVNHITENILEERGVTIETAIEEFQKLIGNSRAVFVAHNANFDMLFLLAAALRTNTLKYFQEKDVLDTLTVYKDRAPYPHKLSDAIEKYGLGETVRNSHGADDDTKALVQVLLAMGREKDDLGKYVNLIGYNPKYPPKYKLKNVTYFPQPYGNTTPLYQLLNNQNKSNVQKENINVSCDISEPSAIVLPSMSPSIEVNPDELILSKGKNGWIIEKYRGFDKPEMLIPGTVGDKKIVGIGDRAFRNFLRVERFYIDDGIISIGNEAFKNCTSLKGVYFPDTLQSIGEAAFGGCYKLHEVSFPDKLEYIGVAAFKGCVDLNCVELANTKVKSIFSYTFFACDIRELTFPKTLEQIQDEAFGIDGQQGRNPNIFRFSPENIVIPEHITELVDRTFLFWPAQSPTHVYIPKGVKKIGDHTFAIARTYKGLTNFSDCDKIIIHCEAASAALDFARERGYEVEEWIRPKEDILTEPGAEETDEYIDDIPDYNNVEQEEYDWYDQQSEIDEELDENFYIGDGDD